MKKSALSAIVVAALAVTLTGSPVLAETINLKANLQPESEVPPVKSSAKGSLTATYDTATKKLTWNGTVSGLTGNATAAHFHGPAEPGENADVLVPVSGVKTGAFEGSADLTADQAEALVAGRTYFNIHTAANPLGEARGQVTQ